MMIKIKINWFQQIQLQEYNGSKFHNHSKQMQEKIFWTNQEDQTLKMIIQSSKETRLEDNIDWRFTSQRLKEALSIYKTPNQCRYRWNHHLRTGLPKQPQWTQPQQIQLFELQEKLGNKWTAISSLIPDKSHTAVKNFFYGSLRKSIRLINSFISEHRNESFYKNFKLFHANCIGKIIAQEQNKKRSKMRVAKANIADSAREIKNVLLKISRDAAERDLIQQAIFCIAEFNRNCRRLRCKKAKSFDESQAECTSKHSFPEHVSKTVKESGLQQKATSKQLLSIAKKPTQYSLQKVGSALFKINELIFKQYPNQKYGTNTEADLRTKPLYVHECQEDMLLNVIKKESSNQSLRFREQSEGYACNQIFNSNMQTQMKMYQKGSSLEKISLKTKHLQSSSLQSQWLPRRPTMMYSNSIQQEDAQEESEKKYA